LIKRKIKKVFISPIEKFVQIESFSGILLLSVTIIALVWANSPYGEFYENLWKYKFGVKFGSFQIYKPLLLWVNDGLMAIFFFLIGLEIKREILLGELNSIRKTSLPFFAAIGGILVPVGLFLLLNEKPETTPGWGIPMATDIAFSLAILTVLGSRVPLALKIFLTAFAIIDDLGAVLTIAVFYSSEISWGLIIISLIMIILLGIISFKGKYNKYLFFLVGTIVWVMFLKSGLHPTIAGVLMAFTIPIRQKSGQTADTDELSHIVSKFKKTSASKIRPLLTKKQIYLINDLQNWTDKFQSPLQHLEHGLHGWVAYFIIPIFALANAGINFGAQTNLDFSLSLNLIISLIIGKSIGVALFSILSVKLGLAVLPGSISNTKIIGTAFLAGIGFTMSIFIANLAFPDNQILIDSSKIGILIGSFASGVIGYLILRFSK